MLTQKLLIILCTISIVFSFAACVRQAEADTQNENSTQEEQNQQTTESQAKANSPVTEENLDFDSSVQQEKSQEPSVNEDHTNEEEYTEEEPTEEELIPLFEKAMNEIISLATNPTDDVLRDIFDKKIECDYMNQIIVDDTPYQWTSRQYSELVDYYSQTFTGEALDWLLDTSFTDGMVSCMPLQEVALPVGRAKQFRLRSWMETPIKEHISLTIAPQRVRKKAQLFP